MNVALVVAVDRDFGIGKNNDLPWHLPEDLKHFKSITTKTQDDSKKNIVIMGRKTWESLPASFRPLPNRINMVLTRNHNQLFESGVLRCSSLEEALDLSEELCDKGVAESVFLIGGGQLFTQGVNHKKCQAIYLTQIDRSYRCDTFFPSIPNNFLLTEELSKKHSEKGGVDYQFKYYVRQN